MKDCKDCRYHTYDSEDGYDCGLDGACPYNGEADVRREGINIVINAEIMEQYIRDTMKNTIENTAREVAEREIKALITKEAKDAVVDATRQAVERMVDEEVERFMSGEMVIGGSWREPARTVTKRDYMREVVESTLENRLKDNPIRDYCVNQAQSLFRDFADRLKRQINNGIKESFTEVMRQTLADSVVSMLMANDTYAKLSDSMQRLIP